MRRWVRSNAFRASRVSLQSAGRSGAGGRGFRARRPTWLDPPRGRAAGPEAGVTADTSHTARPRGRATEPSAETFGGTAERRGRQVAPRCGPPVSRLVMRPTTPTRGVKLAGGPAASPEVASQGDRRCDRRGHPRGKESTRMTLIAKVRSNHTGGKRAGRCR